jgi:hypothetical protein
VKDSDCSTPGLEFLLKESEKQIPRGLKPARNDKNEGLVAAYLKVRPFKALGFEFFSKR